VKRLRPIIYWGTISILAILHLQAVLNLLPIAIPVYVTAILVLGTSYLLNRKILLHIDSLSTKVNGLLFVMQGMLLIMNIFGETSWTNVVPFGLFLSIEGIRLLLSQKMFYLSKSVRDYEEQREQFNETFRVVRSERHDFLKHISALHYMLENHQPDDARNYLEQLVEGYEETNLSIKGERGVVAGVLHQMYRRAKSSGIEVVYDIDIPLSSLPLSDKEIVTLAGNLLSNSIDACEEWQAANGRQATLTLQFYKRSGLFLLICRNDSLQIPTDVLDELFESYGVTTKGDGHEGLGTKLISDLVAKHNGYLDFVHKDEQFSIKIKIPAIL